MKDLVRKAGKEGEFFISSRAATMEEIGNDMDPRARRVLAAHGVPFTKRRATLFSEEDYARADYVIAMDEENLTDLSWMTRGDPEKKVSLLLSWAGENRDVADPWYNGDFETAFRDIGKGCRAVLETLNRTGEN